MDLGWISMDLDWIFYGFHGSGMDFWVENRPQINQKPIQEAIENKMQIGMDSGWLLDRLLVDFGTELGGKLGSSWL